MHHRVLIVFAFSILLLIHEIELVSLNLRSIFPNTEFYYLHSVSLKSYLDGMTFLFFFWVVICCSKYLSALNALKTTKLLFQDLKFLPNFFFLHSGN